MQRHEEGGILANLNPENNTKINATPVVQQSNMNLENMLEPCMEA